MHMIYGLHPSKALCVRTPSCHVPVSRQEQIGSWHDATQSYRLQGNLNLSSATGVGKRETRRDETRLTNLNSKGLLRSSPLEAMLSPPITFIL